MLFIPGTGYVTIGVTAHAVFTEPALNTAAFRHAHDFYHPSATPGNRNNVTEVGVGSCLNGGSSIYMVHFLVTPHFFW